MPGPSAYDFCVMPGHLIRRMHQVSSAIFEAEVRKSGIDLTPVQFAALKSIAAHPGIDQATLASAIAYDRVTIGGVVDRLQHKGFVRRVVSSEDRRARQLSVEPAGHDALRQVMPYVEETQRQILQGLDEAEETVFLHLLEKALEAVGDLSRAPYKPVPRSDETAV